MNRGYFTEESWEKAQKASAEMLGHSFIYKGSAPASNATIHYGYWDSITDLLESDFVNTRNSDVWDSYVRSHTGRDQTYWLGMNSFADVDRAVLHGWPEGLDRARKALEKIEIPKFKSVRRRKKRGDYGDELNMQEVYSGNLDRAWTRTHRQTSPARSPKKVTLLMSSALCASAKPEELFWTGAVALRINDALQESGRSVQIVSSRTNNFYMSGNYLLSANVVIKDYQQPLEPELLAATLCLSGFIRGPMFKSQALMPQNMDKSFGFSIHEFVAERYRESSDSVFLLSDIWSKADAERKIRELINEIGAG